MRLEVAGPILKREAGQGSGAQDWGQEDFNRERVLEMPERSVRKTSLQPHVGLVWLSSRGWAPGGRPGSHTSTMPPAGQT